MSESRTDALGPPPAIIPDVPRDLRGPYAPPPGASPAVPPPPTPDALADPDAGPAASPAIERFRPPRSRVPLVVAFGLGLALVGVLAASGVLDGVLPGTAASRTPTASAPTAQPSAGGVAFSMPADSSSTGRWEILDRVWDADGVDVRVRVVCLTGEVEYAFRAFPRGSATPVRSEASSRTPGIDSGTLTAGESAEGWLRLTLPREESTFFVTTLAGRMLSAQALKP